MTYITDWALPLNSLGITLLLAGMTVGARMPRLARAFWWRAFGVGVFLAGCVGYILLVEERKRLEIGAIFHNAETVGVLGAGALLMAFSWFFIARRKGDLAVLIGGGAVVIAVLVGKMLSGKSEHGAIWPVLLSGAAFLYLWWLSALIFDLVFTWHRYVRGGIMIASLAEHAPEAKKAEQEAPLRNQLRARIERMRTDEPGNG